MTGLSVGRTWSAGVVLSATLAVAVVATQIAYPRVAPGSDRAALTIAIVVLFFGASMLHAAVTRGLRFTAVLVAVTAGGGLLVEAAGVATGVPFGAYAYNDTLGATALGVPLVIPLAWTMMGYPALLVGTAIAPSRRTAAVAGGAALAAWDLFLDPQMVAAGHWTWAPTSGPELLGVPVVNFLGWFVVATAMMAVLLWVTGVPDRRREDAVPLALYVWTYVASVVAHAVYLDLPGSAVAGGVGMGIVVGLLVRAMLRSS